jgi:prepilin-type N-terminal cleavage/methylation domain-containing protein
MAKGIRPQQPILTPSQRSVPSMETLRWFLVAHPKLGSGAGFTLAELLVAMVIGSILSLSLLFTAVQLMGTNQREAARSDTQRELQSALDYIARDLREAVYVYDGECLLNRGDASLKSLSNNPDDGKCPGLLGYLPPTLNQANNLPVLAFWRVDPLPTALENACRANAERLSTPLPRGAQAQPVDTAPCASRRMYTLVVYSLNREDGTGTNRIWKGRSRITRYQLPQYTFSAANFETTSGWVSPIAESGFLIWPRLSTQRGTDEPTSPQSTYTVTQVLVDFVDNRAPSAATCPTAPTTPIAGSPPATFRATPNQLAGKYASNLPTSIFYACVRGSGGGNLNQEVLLRIRGNAEGRAGTKTDVPLTMETRVLTRGILGKT